MSFPCPCCKHLTLLEPALGTYEVCPVCFWEDDLVQFESPDLAGGANRVSLNEARANYLAFGASCIESKDEVRPPRSDEIPE